MREWVQKRVESSPKPHRSDRDTQVRILTCLTDAVIFEEFTRKKFIGAKTFSLEGAETLIPLLDLALEKAGEQNIKEVVLGMAHRGRLNVLGQYPGQAGDRIFSGALTIQIRRSIAAPVMCFITWGTATTGRRVRATTSISLCFNPSHLEFVNPVASGRCRSKMDRAGDYDQTEGMTVLIHGDAAFAGEGVVQETLNLSQLDGYKVGGTLHVIVNNQIGFTTRCG